MTPMIRKRIYIQRRQQTLLRRLARAHGVSQAELIREALGQQRNGSSARPIQPDPAAWDALYQAMLAKRALGPRERKRDDLYTERLKRYGRHTD